MRIVVRDAAAGAARELEPGPAALSADLPGEPGTLRRVRAETGWRAWRAALDGFGFSLAAAGGPRLRFAAVSPEPGTIWLRAGEGPDGALADARARGFEAADVVFWSLRQPYGGAAQLAWDALGAARDERLRLESLARQLAARHGGAAPNLAALAGYRHRFRRCLGHDLDTAGALDRLWDALRPGALSPASQLAALREAFLWLGLDELR